MKKIFACAAAAVMAAGIVSSEARADEWPSGTVTIIVPFSAGGTTDVVGRMLAQHLQDRLGATFVVENRPGAAGGVGLAAGAAADPDGYTLTMVSVSTQAINPFLYDDLPYDPVEDFEAIGLIVETPNMLVVHPDVPAETLEEFIAHLEAHPDELSYGSAGIGTSQHLAGELLQVVTGARATHIPFSGSGEIMQYLTGGHIEFAFDNLSATAGPLEAGQIRAIAIASSERHPAMPDLPAIAETYPGFASGSWLGLVAPAGTPREIVDKLNDEIRTFLDEPAIATRLEELRAIPAWRSPEGFEEYVAEEQARWSEVVEVSGARVE